MTILEATRRNVERRLQVAEQAELHRLAAEHEEAARDAAHRAVSAQEGLGHAHRTAERAAADTAATAEARRAAWERAESAAVERGSAALEEARRQWAEGPAGLEAVRGPRTRAQCGTRAQCAAGGRKAAGTAPRCRDAPCVMRLAGFALRVSERLPLARRLALVMASITSLTRGFWAGAVTQNYTTLYGHDAARG